MSLNRERLQTYESPEGWFALAYPETWEYEVEESCTTFYRKKNGEGVLQISAYEMDEPQSAAANLREYIRGEEMKAKINSSVFTDGREIAASTFLAKGLYTRLWVVTRGRSLVFATYNCDAGIRATEEKDIEAIIESLSLPLRRF